MCGSRSGGGVLALTLTRPERRNAITVAMYAALADAIEQAQQRSGAPPDHIARRRRGFHRRQRPRRFPRGDVRARARRLPSGGCCARSPSTSSRWSPRSTAMRSASARPCCSIATWCWPRKARASSMPFVDLGLVPEAASSLLLPRLAGRRRAARYLLLGEPFGPEEAAEFGLVSKVVPKGALEQALIGNRRGLARQAGGGAAPDPKAAPPRQPRRNPRAVRARERPFRGAAAVGRGQAGDHGLLREEEAGFFTACLTIKCPTNRPAWSG